MKKVAYIIPGYGGACVGDPTYEKVANLFEEKGIEPAPVPINWYSVKNPGKFSDYVESFFKIYKKPKNGKTIVLGFSFGSIVAYLAAARANPDVLILCSISPYFIEDYKNLKPKWLKDWKKETMDSEYSFNEIAPSLVSETYVLVGDKEIPLCVSRAKNARKKIQNSHFAFAKNAGHNIAAKGYLEALKKIIAKL